MFPINICQFACLRNNVVRKKFAFLALKIFPNKFINIFVAETMYLCFPTFSNVSKTRNYIVFLFRHIGGFHSIHLHRTTNFTHIAALYLVEATKFRQIVCMCYQTEGQYLYIINIKQPSAKRITWLKPSYSNNVFRLVKTCLEQYFRLMRATVSQKMIPSLATVENMTKHRQV